MATREPDGTACLHDCSFIPVCSARLEGSTLSPHIGFANSLEGDGEPSKCRRLQGHPSENAPGARCSSILTLRTRTPFHLGSEGHLDQEHFYSRSALNNAHEAGRWSEPTSKYAPVDPRNPSVDDSGAWLAVENNITRYRRSPIVSSRSMRRKCFQQNKKGRGQVPGLPVKNARACGATSVSLLRSADQRP